MEDLYKEQILVSRKDKEGTQYKSLWIMFLIN